MKKRITIFFYYLLFWYVLFVLGRALFLIFYFEKSNQLPVNDLLKTFFFGFRLDIAISAYIAILPSLFLTISSFFNNKAVKHFYHFFTLLTLIVCISIISGDLFMYRHWGFRLDATPLFYMTNLKAMTASVSIWTLMGGIIAVIVITSLLFLIYLKIFGSKLNTLQKNTKSFFILLPLTLFLFIVLRGGIGVSSLTSSSAYFSKNQFANHAAINPIWNVGFSISESGDLKRKYVYYSNAEMLKNLAPLRSLSDSTSKLLNTDRPNIILIITESLTAKALEHTGGRKGVMPELDKLVEEGILFDNIYAASDRTDKGIAAVLAGYPSLPGTSPLKYQKQTEKLVFIPKELNNVGYTSEFFYGGTLDFANYRSFLVQAGYDKMISDKDFTKDLLVSKWGAFDHVVFDRLLSETPDNESMFFKTILTLTSHEPFITPKEPVFKGDDDETKYLNSLNYTDSSIGNFIKNAKNRKWWDNTLIIIIADHGSKLPGKSEQWEKSKYHIPMIWLGGALRVKDTVINSMASQTDLAATLLSQLNISSKNFVFSKNILSTPYIPYAFFTFSDGFGLLKPNELLIYNTITNTYDSPVENEESENKKQGKSYLQHIYLDFFNSSSR
jgi:phosphoglycerol transferase MdoB-like AlkP superfamily enzyme